MTEPADTVPQDRWGGEERDVTEVTSRPRLESSDDRLGHGCGHSGAALDADPRRAPPLMRAHNCGAEC